MKSIIEQVQTCKPSPIVELEVFMTLKNRETKKAMRMVLSSKIKDL